MTGKSHVRPRNLLSKLRLPTKETAPSVSVRPHDVDAALTHVQNFFHPSNVDLRFYAGLTGGALDLTLCTCEF
jgi:hypothetical protein